VVRAHAAAKEVGLKLLIGAEVTPEDSLPVVLLATDRNAYGNLCRLLTLGRRRTRKGDCRILLADIAQEAAGLLACVVLPATSIPERSFTPLHDYRTIFGDRCYALAALHYGPDDAAILRRFLQIEKQTGVPLLASNDVHYHVPHRRLLQDVLTAIRHRCTLEELGERQFSNGERYLKSAEQMRTLFADSPQLVTRTAEISDRCTFSLDELRYEYPEELCPSGKTHTAYLRELTEAGARNRYPQGLPEKVRQTIEHELRLIAKLHYESYFLTVWDLVTFARQRGILCQGRGSAANSAVCYCLGITSVDPDQIDLLFERFVSEERAEAPDIDIDFEHERREEVVQYLYEKYGRDRAGMTATVITYRPRSAIRDVGKALGLSLDRVDGLAKAMDHHGQSEELAGRFREQGFDPASPIARQLLWLVRELLGFPRHLSQHTGGVVITQRPLCELVPIENASMPARTVIQWDKDDLDVLGILKVDCLSLGMLTAIRKTFDLLQTHHDRSLSLATIPQEDSAVYRMITAADTVGVFQVESRAQMAMHPRLKPRTFYDLVIAVALVRPGPIQGDMVNPYLRRRAGEEPVEFPDERIQAVLGKTLGVPLFQEQAMKLAIVAAGFTPGEADQLRRAMAAWRRHGTLDPFREKLIQGMQARGYQADFGERLFGMIRGFGEYGFPESHAVSFALLAYASAWLKKHYPHAFTCALLNSQPMGFYAPAQLVRDAREHHVEVRAVDVNFSHWDCTLESSPTPDRHALRLGFRMIKGMSEKQAMQIVQQRTLPYASFEEFSRRTRFSASVLNRLAKADAFGSINLNRRSAGWQALISPEQQPLFDASAPLEPLPDLPEMPPCDEVACDYNTLGLSLRSHPVSFLREQLTRLKITPAAELAHGPADRWVKVAGIVLMRQRPSTAKGTTFVTIEDETGQVNLIIHQSTWEKYRPIARGATLMMASGRLQRQQQVTHVLVRKLEDGSSRLQKLSLRTRDFR
jgi:error-prone DNA polymerase